MIRVLGRLARGLVTGALTLAVIVGTPWALLHFFGPPVPTAVPDLDTVRDWIDEPTSRSHLLAVVLLIVWAGWAIFAYIIGVEVVAAVRGVRAPRIRLAAPLHTVAAGLVGATATAISSAAAHAAPPAGPLPAPAATASPATAAIGTPGPAAEVPSPVNVSPETQDSTANQLRYEVAWGDWLVGIADRFLGDPDAYPRIAKLNPDLEAADARFPDHIEPGWILVLPDDAVDRGPIPHATGTLLTTAAPTPATPAVPTPPLIAPPSTETAEPSPSAPAEPTGSPTSVYPQPDDDTDLASDDGEIIGGNRIGAMSGAGLLASLALLALQAERRRQTQHRRPGHRLPNPRGGTPERDLRAAEAPADIERLDLALRHVANALSRSTPPDIIGVRLIGGDVHLLLASPSAEPPDPWLDEGGHWILPGSTPLPVLPIGDRPLPTLTAVGSRAGRHLLLDLERHGALTITGDPQRATDLLRYIACELACNTWSEDAEIILVGFPTHETAWLKDLNPHRIVVAASLADEAVKLRRHITATRRATEALDLADTLHGRLRGLAVDAWTPHVLLVNNPDPADAAVLKQLHHDLAAAGRAGAALVAATPSGPAIGDATLAVAADATLTVATPHLTTSTKAAGLPRLELEKVAEILRLARTTELPTIDQDPDPTPTEIQPGNGDIGDSAELVRNLYDPRQWSGPAPTTANGHTDTASPTPDADATLDADLATWAATDANPPRIAILGPVEVTASGPPPERRRGMHEEIAVFLAVHRRGTTQWELADAVWTNGIKDTSVRVAVANLRRWLSNRPDGTPWLPDARATGGRYQIQPGYLLDWALFRRLLARARRQGDNGIDDLRTALSLVRGQPLDGTDTPSYGRNQYTWLGESTIYPPHIVATIIDTAHHLSQHCLDHGDTAGARWAVEQAWLLNDAGDPHAMRSWGR